MCANRLITSMALVFSLTLFWLAAGCSSPQEPDPLCQETVQGNPNKIRPIRANEWLRFIVEAERNQRATRECSGEAIRLPEPTRVCREVIEDDTAVPLSLSEESVIDTPIGNSRRLVWIMTHEFPNGDVMGPVALVERAVEDPDEEETEVRTNVLALGVLRSRTLYVRLRLLKIGRREVLVAEGETCADRSEPTTCQRTAEFLLRDGNRFNQAELRHRSGRCMGRAEMPFSNRASVTLEDGWRRDFSLAASYEIKAGRVIIHEQVTAIDQDPQQPEVPPRPYRSAETVAVWNPVEDHFVTESISLWERMLQEDGSVEVPPNGEQHASR